MKNTPTSLQSALAQAVSAALETLVFEPVELMDETAGPQAEPSEHSILESLLGTGLDLQQYPETAQEPTCAIAEAFWAKLKLAGPFCGEIGIELPGGYARRMAIAVFGSDEDPAGEEVIRDALADTLNTIAGCLMKRLTPPHQEYEIGLPETGLGPCPLLEEECTTLHFKVGGHVLKVMLEEGSSNIAALPTLCR